jgi:preprotein translocase subunit SecG
MYTVLVLNLSLDAQILTVAVMSQAGSGGVLAGTGGAAGTDTIMGGRQATTLLTKVTWWTAGIFLFLALVLTFMSQSGTQVRSVLEGQGQGQQAAPAPIQQTPLPIETQPTAPPPAPPPQPPPNRRP